MVRSVVALALASIAAATPESDPKWPDFQAFIEKYGREYASPSEVAGRFEIFKDNLVRIDERNARGNEKHGINKFADWSPEEFSNRLLGRVAGNWSAMKRKYPTTMSFDELKAKTDSVDWCAQGACTPVKDQGQCGSCWAFGGTEMVESDYFLRFGELHDLSTQQPTSCDTACGGCNGGNAVSVWQYIAANGGQDSAEAYPYTSGTTQQTGFCKSSLVTPANYQAGVEEAFWVSLGAADEGNILADVVLTPLSVAVAAEGLWQTYTGGIVTASSGCGTSLDHNVQVTGYNAEGNYYIVRNSWTSSWGEDGFIYVEAGSNVCGIAEEASVVVTAQPTTKVAV